MASNWQSDTVIEAVRTIIGSAITVNSASIAIQAKPETDLYALPKVSSTNYPLIAIESISEDKALDESWGTVKKQAISVTLALHFVARMEDVTSAGLSSPIEFCRKACEAINEKLDATPHLGTSIVVHGAAEGNGQELESEAAMRAQGLCERTTVWTWVYTTDRQVA